MIYDKILKFFKKHLYIFVFIFSEELNFQVFAQLNIV